MHTERNRKACTAAIPDSRAARAQRQLWPLQNRPRASCQQSGAAKGPGTALATGFSLCQEVQR